MATTGQFNGTKIGVTVDGNLIGHATQHTIDYTANTSSASSKDSGGHNEYIYSFRDGTMSFDALVVYDDDTAGDKTGFFDLFNNGHLGRTVFTLIMGTDESGDSVITQEALLTSLSINASAEETVTYSGSFQFTGAPTVSQNA